MNLLESSERRPSNKRAGWVSALAACLIAVVIIATGGASQNAAADDDVRDTLTFKIRTRTQTQLGRLIGMSAEQLTYSDGKNNVQIPINQVVSITQTVHAFGKTPLVPWVLLTNGDFLRIRPTSIDESTLTGQSTGYKELPALRIPLEFCRAVSWSTSTDPRRRAIQLEALLTRTGDSDSIRLRNGDQVKGEFFGFKDDAIEIETAIGKDSVKLRQVQSLSFNPELLSVPKKTPNPICISTNDGSIWHAKSATLEQDTLTIQLVCGFKVELPITTLDDIRFYSASTLPLSSLPAEAINVRKYLATTRQPKFNRNVLGGRLIVGHQPIGTGIGCMSGTTMTWKLPSTASTFAASVGLDQATGSLGSVRFVVLVDGETKWTSKRITRQSGLVEMPSIEIAGAKTLTLQTQFDDFGNVQDYANWCNPTVLLDR